MHYLFVTIQGFESAFYAVVGDALAERGHEVSHLTYSRLAARRLAAGGRDARSLLDVVATLPDAPTAKERARIEARYGLPSIRDAYRTDPPCAGKPEAWSVRRAVDHFRAVEAVLDDVRPDLVVPEVG